MTPVQEREYDDALWVLGAMSATLRGYDTTNLRSDEIPDFRRVLCRLLSYLIHHVQ